MLKSTYNNRIITFVYTLIKFSLNAKQIPQQNRNHKLRKLLHTLNTSLIQNRKNLLKT